MNTKPDVGHCLRDGWELYLREPMLLTGATLVVGVINTLASIVPFANLLVGAPLLGGLYMLVIRIDKGEPAGFGNLFDGFQLFLPLVIASLAVSLIICIGVILLIIPGIYFAVAYGFTNLLIVDRKLAFWPAMETSRRTITHVFWNYLLLACVLLVALIIGSIPLGLGLLVAVPFCMAAQYSYYKHLVDDGGLDEYTAA